MSYCISPRHIPLLPIDLAGFKPSCITLIEGPSEMVPGILFHLCAHSVVSLGRDAVFVDGGNIFDPYALSRIAKSLSTKPRKVLSRIHVARAFTEYQMDSIISESLGSAIEGWNPAVLGISYLPYLFSGVDGRKLFKPLLERLKSLTVSHDIITAVTSFGGTWYGDRLLASMADRVVRIEEKKKLIRIIDDGHVTEYIPVPPWQMRLANFTGGDVYGQDSAELPQPA